MVVQPDGKIVLVGTDLLLIYAFAFDATAGETAKEFKAPPRAPPPTAERPRPNAAERDCLPTSSRPSRRTHPRIRRRLSLRTVSVLGVPSGAVVRLVSVLFVR